MRAAITGIGLLTPLGRGAGPVFDALAAGRSGIGRVTRFDASSQRSRIAGEVRGYDPSVDLPTAEARTTDRFQQFSISAALDAVRDAGLGPAPLGERAAVILGVGIGGIETIEKNGEALASKGPRRVSPYFIPAAISNLGPSMVAMRLGARGPCFSVVSACASGAHALGEALWAIRSGRADLVIAGGAEAAVTPLTFAGFAAMRALSERNDDPSGASRPFDRGRDGFVIGEGAGVFVIESEDRARRRGARVHGFLAGYGATEDAHHITQPDPDGGGMARAMSGALADAGIAPGDVAYLNAHATSTPLGDRLEAKAIRAVFGPSAPPVSSTKSAIGHLLGAAGAVEAAFALMALERGVLPPTLNQQERDPEIDLDVIPNEARPSTGRFAVSNAFGFGGTNCSLVLARSDEGGS